MKRIFLLLVFLLFSMLLLAQNTNNEAVQIKQQMSAIRKSTNWGDPEKVVTEAQGTCDNMPRETKIVPKDIKIPLKVIFGPYNGKTTDKLLKQKDSKASTDPATRKKTTITIDFTLNQQDK